MTGARTMLSLAKDYLSERRALGFALRMEGHQITAFALFADERGHSGPLTNDIVLNWVQGQAKRASPFSWARRLEVLRPFAKYLARLDPGTEFPQTATFGGSHRRLAPHIYSEQEICGLVAAALRLAPEGILRPATYATIFGLIAATGLRRSEALHLRCGDVDLDRAFLTVRNTKFRKSRHVPIHATVVAQLQRYLAVRARYGALTDDTPLFLSTQGGFIARRRINKVFQKLRTNLGWTTRGGHGAVRIHDLRHTFICRRIQLWHEHSVDIDNTMAALSTYVGHAKISDTYWYLTADGALIEIPATPETLDVLASLPDARPPKADRQESAEADATDKAEPEVLLIEDNLEALGYARALKPRVDPSADALPSMVKAKLKPHQESGLAWMKEAWRKGEPGVLLADDKGLGKTLQCLAFLEWIKRCQQLSGQRRPMLVVAPTSLLRNWEQEDETHLRRPGLGTALRLSGRALRDLQRRGSDDMGLDIDRLRDADWVLTTYETMRNHEMSLAGLRFAVVVFDEIQKIKNPASLVTKAAKTLNADFVLGLTGTPIENRLADLWSIADRVQEGLLGDLKSFSQRYEREDTPPETLGELRQKIIEPRGGQPAFMVRRMKEEQLEGLPEKRIEPLSTEMPPVQADAYRAVLAGARDGQKGKMLEALQAMRRVSLHPHAGDLAETPADEIIQASARWRQAFAALDRIASAGEKALIFLETIALQKDLATLIQRRFGLSDQPMIINGGVSGDRRQQRVNAFQNAAPGFDVMILGPRAAGVGLTLTAANHVIHLTRWWNPAVEDQCTDRVFRIGQQKPVTVWLPQAIYPDDPERSFDVQLDKLLQRKRSLSRDMLTPPAGTDQDAADLFRATVG